MGGCGSSASASGIKSTAGKKKQTTCVLGASGYVGKTTVLQLSKTASQYVRILAGSRDPQKLKQSFGDAQLPGVEFIKADMNSPVDQLAEALKDVHSVFIVTPGPTENRGQIALNAARACKKANVQFTVVVSVLTANHKDTIFGKQFGPLEEGFWQLGIQGCVLRLPMFMDNLMGFFGTIADKGQFYAPITPTNTYSPVALIDVAEAYIHVIHDPKKHKMRTYSLYSDCISHLQLQEEFRTAMGSQNVTFVQVPPEAAVEAFKGFGMPDWQAQGVVELYKLAEDRDAVMISSDTKTLQGLIGKKPTSLKAWIAMNSEAIKNVKVPEASS